MRGHLQLHLGSRPRKKEDVDEPGGLSPVAIRRWIYRMIRGHWYDVRLDTPTRPLRCMFNSNRVRVSTSATPLWGPSNLIQDIVAPSRRNEFVVEG